MAELETVEICSPKDPDDKWILNAADYDPSIHVLWSERMDYRCPLSNSAGPESHIETVPSSANPALDFVFDDMGELIAIHTIGAGRGAPKHTIPVKDYDPDTHRLWSTATRNRA